MWIAHLVVDSRERIWCTGKAAQPGNDSCGARRIGLCVFLVSDPGCGGRCTAATGPAVVALVGDQPLPGDALQLIGDGLLVALALQSSCAADLTVACVRALRERGGTATTSWPIDWTRCSEPAPPWPLPVDLEELAGVMEGDPTFGGGRLDLLTGQVWPQAAIDYARPPRL